MARSEQDREDLLKEATALVERVEVSRGADGESVFLGVRRDGALSIYFSADEAYHFNTQHELRRAYLAGQLLKAEEHRLVALTRHRMDSEVQLLRHELDNQEQHVVIERLCAGLQQLRQAELVVRGTVPSDLPARERIAQWLAPLEPVRIAAIPHAR